MPKQNPYLIKENYKKVEEVREIENKELITPEEQTKLVDKLVKNEIPSYEEFMKTYQEDEGVIDNYYYEIDSYGDIRIVKCYGPGFWDEFGGPVSKTLISMGASALILGTGGAAAPIVIGGAALAAGGKGVKELGKELDCGVLEWIGDTACDTGIGTLTGSIAGGSGSLASHISKETAKGGHVVAGVMRTAKFSHDTYGKAEVGAECHYRKEHRKHQERGVRYDSDCPFCTKSWPFN